MSLSNNDKPGVGVAGEVERGPANSFGVASPLLQFVVKYFDADGRAHDVVGMRVGEEWLIAPNSEEWLKGCKRFPKKISVAVEERYQNFIALQAAAASGTRQASVPTSALSGGMPKPKAEAAE